MTTAAQNTALTAEEKKAAAQAKRAATIAAKKAAAAQEQEQQTIDTAPADTAPAAQEQAAPVDGIEAARVALTKALRIREAAADEKCKTIGADIAWFDGSESEKEFARAALTKAAEMGFDLDALAAHIANTEKGKGKPYLAIKAITKMRQMFTAFVTGFITDFDKYTYAVLVNMVTLQKSLDTFDMMRCVSKSVRHHDAMRKGVSVETITDSDPSTASTQVSSTRGFLGDLHILQVNKGKKGDAPAWADNAAAVAVRAWFEEHVNG